MSKRGRKPKVWTPEMDAMFDTMNDRMVADRLSLSSLTVRKRRLKIGKPANYVREAKPPKVIWTPAMDALLGTKLDRLVAEELSIPAMEVSERRNQLGIPKPCRRSDRWKDPNVIAQLGTKTDVELAKELGVGRERVRQIRKLYRVEHYAETQPDWASVHDRLGIEDDQSIAADLGLTPGHVQRYRAKAGVSMQTSASERFLDSREDVPENWRELIGTISDRKLGKMFGVPTNTIVRLRLRMNLPPAVPKPPVKVNWKDPSVLTKLGKITDSELARELGVSVPAVTTKRMKLGIPALHPKVRRNIKSTEGET